MQDWLVRLRFTSPVHFGEDGIGQEKTATRVHSDTLYSAIWSLWARYGLTPGLDQLLHAFQHEEPPFRLSSAFLFDKRTHYLPRPSRAATGLDGHDKRIKKAQYLPLDLFAEWVAGRPVDPSCLAEAVQMQRDACREQLRPRVALDRLSHRSVLHSLALITFAPDAGLWFLVRLADAQLLRPLQQAVHLLGEHGLGGERSSGLGAFSAEWENLDDKQHWQAVLRTGESDAGYCLLSLCNPAEEELGALFSGGLYGIIERKGWVDSFGRIQGRRKPVRMLTEGSVFTAMPRGRVVDVSPAGWEARAGHKIYRSGLAFAVPVRGEGRP